MNPVFIPMYVGPSGPMPRWFAVIFAVALLFMSAAFVCMLVDVALPFRFKQRIWEKLILPFIGVSCLALLVPFSLAVLFGW